MDRLLLGTALLTAALIRRRAVAVWAPVAFAAEIVINVVGFTANSVALIAAGDVVLLAGSIPLARHLVSATVAPNTRSDSGSDAAASGVA